MATQMVVRIEPELKKKVDRIARIEGRTTSTVVRELLEGYVRDRDIEGYIDGLWNRIGTRLAAKQATPASVKKAIKDSRKAK